MILKNHLKRVMPSLSSVVFVLVCFAIAPLVRAVVPPPDGGYPNFTTAEGQNALLSLTTGVANTAVGWYSLFSNTDGSFNTAVGAGTLLFNVGDQSSGDGTRNTAIGTAALLFNTTGFGNTATGSQALQNHTTGSGNTAHGDRALYNHITGEINTATGFSALISQTSGNGNTAIGYRAGGNITTGEANTCLGADTCGNVTTASNVICIGASVDGANASDRCFIGNIYENVQPIVGTNPDSVTITMSGRLGRGNVSSRRYKHDIQPMEKASEMLYALKPVSFRYNKEYDDTQTLAFGLIAEEVAEVYPDLVGRNEKGEPESVRYQQINAIMLNEFLKAHRKVQELEANAVRQQKQIETLTAGLQKVSAQLEASRPAPQTVLNKQ
jgi:Chaperone of endosialidase